MGDFLFDEHARFYFSKAGHDYTVPPEGTLAAFLDSIQELPLYTPPTVFGLHTNAELSYYSNASRSLWRNMIELQPRTAASGGGMSREQYINTVAADIAGRLPDKMDVLPGQVAEPPTPTQVVLLQELDRFHALLKNMRLSLVDLQRALKGDIGMSAELDKLGSALYNGDLPARWRRLAPATEKPLGSWMQHFLRRHAQYLGWLNEGEPKVMWLSGLHIPESYLTALVQTACRKRGWPLDKSTLYTKVTKFRKAEEVESRPEFGCLVEGLYLEGAAWDFERACLRQQDPKVLVTELPIVQVIPTEASRLRLQSSFKTPVYMTQQRRNAMGVGLVFEADLTTNVHESHWILQGVGLTLNTDE